MDAVRHQAAMGIPDPVAPADAARSEADAMRLLGDLEAQVQGLKRLHAERERARVEVEERQAEIERRSREQAERDERLSERERQAAERLQAAEARLAEAEERWKALEVQARQAAERSAHIDQQRAALEGLASELEARERAVAERAAKIDQLQHEVRNLTQRLAETERLAAGRAEELLRSQDEAVGLARRVEELTSLRASAERQIASLRAEVERAAAAGRNADTDRQARERVAAEAVARADEAAAELARARARVEELTLELEQARATPPESPGLAEALEAARAEAARADEARREVAESLNKAVAYTRKLKAQLIAAKEEAESRAKARPADDALVRLRRERMRRCRALLRERSAKIRQASEILRTRHQQYEQVAAMRGEVLNAKRALDAQEKRVRSTAARTRASAAMFYLAGMIAVLAALSWAVVQQVVPADYIARAVIVPEARGRSLSDAELADWQAYHEGLLADPQFLELAAERMARRGIATLATPGELKAELDAALVHDSARDGQLVLELRGQGAERTQRVLDTYVTALVSRANTGKERRVDGAATAILEPARASVRPVEDRRPIYAAGLLGASTGLFLLIGGVIWTRLAAAKARFEREAAVEEGVAA